MRWRSGSAEIHPRKPSGSRRLVSVRNGLGYAFERKGVAMPCESLRLVDDDPPEPSLERPIASERGSLAEGDRERHLHRIPAGLIVIR